MGGKYPGKYPPKMRMVAVVNMILLSFITTIVLSEADLMFPQLRAISGIGIWFVVIFFITGTIMNTITQIRLNGFGHPYL